MIDTSMFPYFSHPIRLEYEEKKGSVVCFFECEEHLKKHLERYKLNKKKVSILHRPDNYVDELDNLPVVSTSQRKTRTTKKVDTKAKTKIKAKRKPRTKKND